MNKVKLGLFGIGLEAYWPQFKGLKPRLEGYLKVVAAPYLVQLQGPPRRAIIVGINEQGLALAGKINHFYFTRLLTK